MKKSQAIAYVNHELRKNLLSTRNTTFATLKEGRPNWWMNIKFENFKREWNILLLGELELKWLQIPANTFQNLRNTFRIWESKGAVDILISGNKGDRYFKDVSSGGSGVNFKPFLKGKFPVTSEMLTPEKGKHQESSRKGIEHFSSHQKNEAPQPGQKILKNGESDISYQSLFAEYLKGSNRIIIQDPYIRYPHQFKNLLEFCLMLMKLKPAEKIIELELVTWNEKEFHGQSKTYFDEVVSSVKDLNIKLSYNFENHHDRFIQTDTGWKIILGRGLDIFHKPESRFSIGDLDQKHRKCKPCEITYIKMR